MSNALAQAARTGFRPVGENSMVRYSTAKQQGGECCSLILQLSDKNLTQSWLPVTGSGANDLNLGLGLLNWVQQICLQ